MNVLFALLSSLTVHATPATQPDTSVGSEERIPIGGLLRELAFPLPDPVSEALRERRWDAALAGLRSMDTSALTGATKGDWAFLVAWCATHIDPDGSEGAAAAEDVLGWMDDTATVPEAYAALVRGEVLLATGEPLDALEWLDRVPGDAVLAPRATLIAGAALRELGRTKEAWERVETLIARPDPADGNPAALLSLAEHRGAGSEEAGPLLRRLWTFYPHTAEGRTAATLLANNAGPKPTWQQVAHRAEQWMNTGSFVKAMEESAPIVSHIGEASVDGCRLRYVRGRSEYKRNRITAASTELAGIGAQCEEVAGTYGPRGLYLLGTAQYRRKQFRASADAYADLAARYPDHSMADDAWTRGGISLLEGGDVEEARRWWESGLTNYPDGDTVPEAALRLAFARYDDGDTPEAIRIAEQLAALPRKADATHVEAGRYWAARWRLYPDATAPTRAVDDAEIRADAVERWRTLCAELPNSFYAILAYSRLVEVAPEVAQGLADRPEGHADGSEVVPWEVRLVTTETPAVRDGVALVRLGLVSEGLAEWRQEDDDTWSPDEKAWTTELRIAAGDWLLAHDDMRRWIHTHPLGSLGPREAQIVRLAYPDRYWDEVQTAVPDKYRYDPRLFHALVREESNFNRRIVSFAGAMGLSQLMWPTAQQTAGWLGLSITRSELNDPQTNLNIGGRYLEAMHKQLSDSPYLSLAAYNGGASNVNKWNDAHGNPPLDEFVERIPFRETRGYVKRVMGTWQTMRYRFDDGPAFPDLSAYNHKARP